MASIKNVDNNLAQLRKALDERNDFGGTPLQACVWGSAHFRDPKGDYPACTERLIAAGAKVVAYNAAYQPPAKPPAGAAAKPAAGAAKAGG